jgi:hypothetical protein
MEFGTSVHPLFQVRVFQTHKLLYQSLDDGSSHAEFIRTHESFHGRSVEDSVFVQQADGLQCAKVLMMMEITIKGTCVQLALANLYSLVTRRQYTVNDRATGFMLLQQDALNSTCFLPIRLFVRKAFVVPVSDFARSNHFLVNDVIDPDTFFRLRILRQQVPA